MFRWWVSAALVSAVAGTLAAQPETVIRVDVNLVRVVATVKNRAGQLVGALNQPDFEIYDNGARQEIALFERQTEQPLSVALLIDVSGSTTKDLKLETDSALKFLRALLADSNPRDQVALYSFDDTVRLVQDFTHSIPTLDMALKRVHGSAGTSLYDAIWLSAREGLEMRDGRKVMVIVSDGGDTTSVKDSHQALEAVQLANVLMYPVVILPIMSNAGRNTGGENAMAFMSQGTGGRMFLPQLGAQLDKAFADIILELRTEYLLGFYPHGEPLTKDRFHKLEVRVKSPELQVSARNGYYGDAESGSGSPDQRISVDPRSSRKKK